MSVRFTTRSTRPALPTARRFPGSRAAALCTALLAAGTTLAQSNEAADARPPPDSPIVPVHDEPHHRQLFQHGAVRILELQIPPDDMSWFHTHEWPVLYMTLGLSSVRMQNLGDDWTGAAREDGDADDASFTPRPPADVRATSTTSYIDEPITHRLENTGNGLFRAMVVVNETQGDETTSVEAAGFDATPELTNAWFRSYRVTLDAGETTQTHRHHAPVAVFQASDGTGIATGPMSFELNEPGQWAFFDADTTHEIRNLGDGTLELLEIEARQP